MTRRRALVLIIVALVAIGRLVPAAREQCAWWWAESRDQAGDYTDYLETWPHGRHAVQARFAYEERRWIDTKNAMIREAYTTASQANPEGDPTYQREERLRRENFLWKEITSNQTVDGYKDYLKRYPHGMHVAEARRQLVALTQQGESNPSGTQ